MTSIDTAATSAVALDTPSASAAQPVATEVAGPFLPDPTDLRVERTGTRTYIGRNARGAEVLIGPMENEGSFSPGELLKLALAACTGLTTDAVFARRLGDDYEATIAVGGLKDQVSDSYPAIVENVLVDLDGLNEKERTRLLTIVHRAVDEHCTVGRTVTAGTSVRLEVNEG